MTVKSVESSCEQKQSAQYSQSSINKTSVFDRLARQLIFSRLRSSIRNGNVVFRDALGCEAFGSTDEKGLSVEVNVIDLSLYSDMLLGGLLGAAESYMAGGWTASDVTKLIRIFASEARSISSMDSGLARLFTPLLRLFHWLNRNTRTGSRKNISEHYDLGNDFFKLFLDPTMTYSAGVFESVDATMEDASIAKIERLCRKLDLKSSDHILEIGTGWGSFAIYAAKTRCCQVTTTTISKEQYEYANQRVREAGLEDRITVLMSDYRDLVGSYDKIVSIEMIEAVGHQFHNVYFRKISDLLKPDGLAAIQAIIIDDRLYSNHIREVDFIKKYIFPGSCLTSISGVIESVKKSTDMRLFHFEDITSHYAKTLRLWREKFFQNIDAIRALGFSDTFIRMWDFYLCYCEEIGRASCRERV